MKKIIIRSIGLFICLAFVSTSQGQTTVVYANNQSLINPPNGVQLDLTNGITIGNTITLTPSSPRNMVGFSFEYYGKSPNGTSYSGTPSLTVSFYQNNGPLVNGIASPGSTPFFTDTFYLNNVLLLSIAGGVGNINFTNGFGNDFPVGGTPIPASTITWTAAVTGLNSADQFGLVAFDPTAPGNVGGGYGQYYWQNNGSSWQTYTNNISNANNFGVEVWAVPEPATIALAAIGGMALLVAVKRRQRP